MNLLWRARQEGHTDVQTEPAAWLTTMGAAHVDKGAEKRGLTVPEKDTVCTGRHSRC